MFVSSLKMIFYGIGGTWRAIASPSNPCLLSVTKDFIFKFENSWDQFITFKSYIYISILHFNDFCFYYILLLFISELVTCAYLHLLFPCSFFIQNVKQK